MLHKDSKRDSVFQRRSLLDFDCPQPFNVEIGEPEMADEQVHALEHGVLGGGMKRSE